MSSRIPTLDIRRFTHPSSSPTTQRNANRLAALLKPEAKTNKQRREQLNRALSK